MSNHRLATVLIGGNRRIVLWNDWDFVADYGAEEDNRRCMQMIESHEWEAFGLTLEEQCSCCGAWSDCDKEPGLWGIVVESPLEYTDDFVRNLWRDHVGNNPEEVNDE
jgi:hypothetical protein